MIEKVKKLVKELVEQRRDDPSAPSLIISMLPNGKWYGSLATYTGRFGQGKEVLCSAQCHELEQVIDSLEYQRNS